MSSPKDVPDPEAIDEDEDSDRLASSDCLWVSSLITKSDRSRCSNCCSVHQDWGLRIQLWTIAEASAMWLSVEHT